MNAHDRVRTCSGDHKENARQNDRCQAPSTAPQIAICIREWRFHATGPSEPSIKRRADKSREVCETPSHSRRNRMILEHSADLIQSCHHVTKRPHACFRSSRRQAIHVGGDLRWSNFILLGCVRDFRKPTTFYFVCTPTSSPKYTAPGFQRSAGTRKSMIWNAGHMGCQAKALSLSFSL